MQPFQATLYSRQEFHEFLKKTDQRAPRGADYSRAIVAIEVPADMASEERLTDFLNSRYRQDATERLAFMADSVMVQPENPFRKEGPVTIFLSASKGWWTRWRRRRSSAPIPINRCWKNLLL